MSKVLAMPVAGLTFADVSLAALECRGNRVRTARRLGVGIRSLDAMIKREGLERWFLSQDWRVGPRPAGSRSRTRCITREQIIEVAGDGVSQMDAAYLLGVSYAYLKDLVADWGLRSYFPSHGDCVRAGQMGYAR